jgi:hypothetical protein
MSSDLLYFCGLLAGALPFLAIAVILLHYFLRRTAWKLRRRRGENSLGFCPSAAALGMALLFTQIFLRPSLQHVIEQRQEENGDEDDQGDPEGGEKDLDRQLKRIRRSETIADLILRL